MAAAVRFVAVAWRRAWAALLLAAVLSGIYLASPVRSSGGFWLALACLATLAARGAAWRLASGQTLGPGGLRLGRVEARLASVWVLSALFLSVLGLLFFVVILAFAYAAASAGHGFDPAQIATWAPAVDSRGRVVVTVVGLLAAGLLIWAATRISLAEAATTFGGRLVVLETWPLTRGRVLRILASNLALAVTPVALVVIRDRFLSAGMAAPAACFGALTGLLFAGLWLPMSVGLMAYFHERRASPPAP